jgi:acyl-CoA synthetase (AMP-forming)/AMP-acid ligase II
MLLSCLTARPSALTLPRFKPMRFARLLQTGQVGTVFVVPAMAIELLGSGVLHGRDLSGVHLVGSTAAPLPAAIALRLTQAFPQAAIVNYYTSTEAAPAQTSMIFDPARPDAVGRPAPGSILITNADGAPTPPGAIGDVWLRSPHPRSYLGDDTASTSTFQGEWVRMGDVGRLADGYLYLIDRDSDVVKSGAHKVSTLEVEAAIYEHPAVADAAVVGVPHPVLGKQLAAAVVARAPIGLPALRAFLADRLADHQLPAQLLLLESLPRNESGKVSKRELAAQFPTDAGRQA